MHGDPPTDEQVLTGPDRFEEQLLERARAGDADAFSELLERYQGQLKGVLRQMLGARADLDDLLQEARLKALRALPGFKGRARFGTWISRIAINLAISELRKLRVRQADPLPTEPVGDGEEPWVHAQRTELRERLAAAVGRLPPALAEVFQLRYRDGLDGKTMAGRLGIPAATVRTRLFHARRRLREALDDLV